jgi:D-alanyl-D-alanine dipeptidase
MSGVNLSSVRPSKRKPGARGRRKSFWNLHSLVALTVLALGPVSLAQSNDSFFPGPKPPDAPSRWKQLTGIYFDEDSKHSYIVLEDHGQLLWRDDKGKTLPLSIIGDTVFPPSEGTDIIGHSIARDDAGNATSFCYLNFCYVRTDPGARQEDSKQLSPARSIERLRNEALAASPPTENHTFRKPDLVELAPLDPAIHLDIRYATANDFLGVPVYTQARAFLQRPAAEALLRALHKLQPLGYGLLIHDGYRPWYVTKIFWDATPPEGKIFVADPVQGSRHNRGCAVDLTLYDLKTGQPIEMTGEYDEMSPRSFPNYPGGTSLQRWHRDLLRRAMESEGFTVYEAEWWHFDYKDWREYGILNIPFEKLNIGSSPK